MSLLLRSKTNPNNIEVRHMKHVTSEIFASTRKACWFKCSDYSFGNIEAILNRSGCPNKAERITRLIICEWTAGL